MKKLAGKFCRRCNGQNIAIAAEGQVMVVRCLDCTNFSTFCPEPACVGRMFDKAPKYKEQKCTQCGYETTFQPQPTAQVQLFDEIDGHPVFV